MLLDRLNVFLKERGIIFRAVSPGEYPAVLEAEQSNAAYFSMTQETPLTLLECAAEITAMPPGFSPEGKHFTGIWQGDSLLGVLDFLEGYPDGATLYIGLFLLAASRQRQGLGTLLMNAVFDSAGRESWAGVQLGVLEQNATGLAFWKQLGFSELRRSRELSHPDWQVVVLRRALSADGKQS